LSWSNNPIFIFCCAIVYLDFITYIVDGAGHTLDGQGGQYWDGKGLAKGATTKPVPLLRINQAGGTFSNVKVLNSPARAVSIGGDGVVVSKLTVDNCK
jgi:polygalacturonase